MKQHLLGFGLVLPVTLVGCVEHKDSITGTQSLEVAVTAPADPGSVENRLPDSQRNITIDLTARDADNNIDATYTKELRVYANYLGTLTPELQQTPLTTIQMTNGIATGQVVPLPNVYGPTSLWIDDGSGVGQDYEHGRIAGTSETLWFRDPFIRDLQQPEDEMALDALSASPLQNKQVRVGTSRHGANGKLVVTSTYAQGYTVSDVNCPGGNPPCTADAYDHILVFTFSSPRNQFGDQIVVGDVVEAFSGGQSEFNGLTELGFPRTYVPEMDGRPSVPTNPALVPAPVRFDVSWFGPLNNPDGRINFEKNESGAIEIVDALVCPLDEEYATYKQWKLDPSGMGGAACSGDNVLNLITVGTSFTTDPATLVGKKLARVVGIVRPVSIGSFNVWIVYPRGAEDITVQ